MPTDDASVYAVANGCFSIGIESQGSFLTANAAGREYQIRAVASGDATHFIMRPTDLGSYLLLDENNQYLTSEGDTVTPASSLRTDTRSVDGKIVIEDKLVSEGEWQLHAAPNRQFTLGHMRSGSFLLATGALGEESEAAPIELVEQTGCAISPELSVDASGEIAMTEFDDGSVFGFVETHSHLFTNFAFGGGVFHGAPFHRLGVEHALADCDLVHGEDGRRDILGFAFGDLENTQITDLLPSLVAGILPQKNHNTQGYPDFTDWPDAHRSATHQMQHYKWVERAWMGGLRLLVQHATTNQVLCQLVVGIGPSPSATTATTWWL